MNARIWDAEVFLIGLCSLPDIRKSAVSQNQLRRRRSTIKKMEFMYICCQCDKQFSHQSNIIRHTKKCGNKKQKQVYDCHKCEKSFSFKCRLTAHLKNHVLICNVCNSKFRRPELFDQHRMNCVDLQR